MVVGDRHNAGHDRNRDGQFVVGIDKAKVGFGVVKILGDSAVSTRIDLGFEILQVRFNIARVGVGFWIGRDLDMEVNGDGSYEIIVSRDKPASGNWLELKPGSGQITTRHYHESRQNIASVPGRVVPINLEVIDPDPLTPYGGDEETAKHLEWVANYVREHSAITFNKTSPEMAKKLGWVSLEPNEFAAPGQFASATGDTAYGNAHAWYASARYELEPDEALIIRGRFPGCRFANVVLWNQFMQSYDFVNRQISLNRNQIEYEKDGSFKMVVAHEDPGVPNWLDTEGRSTGQIYWRYIFPTQTPQRVKTKLVKLASLS